MERGKIKYIPKITIIELEDIKREDNIKSDAEAWREFTRYTRVGREAKRFVNFGYNWKKKANLPKVDKPKKKDYRLGWA